VNETFTNFENLLGSDNDDSLRGDGSENVLQGAAGDDTLIWSGGEDVLDGGEGFDTADYSTSSVPVVVALDDNGNGTATRETGFSVVVENGLAMGHYPQSTYTTLQPERMGLCYKT